MRNNHSIRPWLRQIGENGQKSRSLDALIALQDRIQSMLADYGVDRRGFKPLLVDWIALHAVYALPGLQARVDDVHNFVSKLLEEESKLDILLYDPATLSTEEEIYSALEELWVRLAILEALRNVVAGIKDLVVEVWTVLLNAMPETLGSGAKGDVVFSMRRIDMIPHVDRAVDMLTCAPFANFSEDPQVLDHLRERLVANLGAEPNEVHSRGGTVSSSAMKRPSENRSESSDVLIASSLSGTPLRALFYGEEKIAIPLDLRLKHQFLVAGGEHDENDVLEAFLTADIEAVKEGERSVVVIDRDGTLVRRMTWLRCFAEGHALHEKIRIIDPFQSEFPSCVNLFDIGKQRLAGYRGSKRRQILNSLLPLYEFVLGPLFSEDLTAPQRTLLRHATRLLLHVPGANALTLLELMIEGSEKKFANHIAELSDDARRSFEADFSSPDFRQIRSEVYFRISRILQNDEFRRVFSQPASNLDLFSDMNEGKVILFQANDRKMSGIGNSILGRFAVAAVTMAAQERIHLLEFQRKPAIVYANCADDYCDGGIGSILSRLRRFRVGMILAQRNLGRPGAQVLDTVAANTGIKFVGGLAGAEAEMAGAMLGWTPAFFEGQKRTTYAARLQGTKGAPIPLTIPPQMLDALPRMSAKQRRSLFERMGVENMRAQFRLEDVPDASARRDAAPSQANELRDEAYGESDPADSVGRPEQRETTPPNVNRR